MVGRGFIWCKERFLVWGDLGLSGSVVIYEGVILGKLFEIFLFCVFYFKMEILIFIFKYRCVD